MIKIEYRDPIGRVYIDAMGEKWLPGDKKTLPKDHWELIQKDPDHVGRFFATTDIAKDDEIDIVDLGTPVENIFEPEKEDNY